MKLEGWEHRSLTDLAQYINGYAFKPDDWEKEGLPIIRIEQLKNPDSICDYYSGKIPDSNIIDNGDLIFSWSASLFLRFWNNGRAALNQHLFKVEAYENTDKYFLKSFIEFYLPEITKASHGSTMQHITRKELDRFGALVPIDKKEQEQIAEVLSTIDRAIAQTKAIIAKQQRIKTGLMQDLLTKGIDEHGNIRSEASHEFKDSEIGRIPVEWDVEEIRKIASLQRGHDIREVEFIAGKYPVVASSGIIGFHNLSTSDSPNVVVGRKGSIGNVYYLDVNFWAHDTSLYVTNFFGNNEKYIYYLFSYLELERFGTKSGSPSLNRNDIHPLRISLPKPSEQKLISKMLTHVDTLISNLKSGLNKLQRQKTGLMQDILTGKGHVTNLLKEREAASPWISPFHPAKPLLLNLIFMSRVK